MPTMKKNNSLLISTPYIIWMVVFTLIPLGVVAYYAFTDPATGAFTWDNILQIKDYLPALLRSVGYALSAAVICLVMGYPVAYYVSKRKPMTQKILYMLIMLPMCMSFLLRTMAWVGLLQDTGIINNFLEAVGLHRVQLIRTPGAVILGMVYNYLPYMILPLYTVLSKMDHRLIEAAEDLGCNGPQVFGRVILPLSIPGILSGFTMVFVPAVSTFYISQKLGGKMKLIGDEIEEKYANFDFNGAAAIAFIMMVLLLVVMALLQHRATKRSVA
jgi:spermidine/putrescine transport system permease protein